MIRTSILAAITGILAVGMGACEKQGPAERAGEEVDEAVDTLRNGGKETTADKLDDAADKARESAQEAADAAKKN